MNVNFLRYWETNYTFPTLSVILFTARWIIAIDGDQLNYRRSLTYRHFPVMSLKIYLYVLGLLLINSVSLSEEPWGTTFSNMRRVETVSRCGHGSKVLRRNWQYIFEGPLETAACTADARYCASMLSRSPSLRQNRRQSCVCTRSRVYVIFSNKVRLNYLFQIS